MRASIRQSPTLADMPSCIPPIPPRSTTAPYQTNLDVLSYQQRFSQAPSYGYAFQLHRKPDCNKVEATGRVSPWSVFFTSNRSLTFRAS